MAELLTQYAYAKHRGVNEQAVAKAIHDGRITAVTLPDGTKRIDPEVADKEWEDNTRESQNPSYSEARAYRETVNAQIANMELERRQGKLVELAKVKIEFFNCARTVRNALLALPDRLASVVASNTDPAECHRILAEEIDKVLENLSSGYRSGGS